MSARHAAWEFLGDRVWLEHEYARCLRTQLDIAAQLDCGSKLVREALAAHGIPIRSRTHQRQPQARRYLDDREWLRNEYERLGRTADEIAEQLDCHRTLVYSMLDRHGIPRRVGGPKGRPAHNRIHGMTNTPAWRSWASALNRTTNPNNRAYHNYGGRSNGSITMCVGWRGRGKGRGFVNFFADLGDPPDGMSLERIDNDGGYWCGHCEECIANGWSKNCRWATDEEQQRNRRGAVAYERVKREHDAVTVERDAIKEENAELKRKVRRLQRELRQLRKVETNGAVR